MSVETGLILTLFGIFIGMLFIGIPVGYSLCGSSLIVTTIAFYMDTYGGTFIGLDFKTFNTISNRVFEIMKSDVLVALPMFILMGNVLDRSGVAEKMMLAQQQVLGRFPGGLAIGVTFMGVMLAASTGIIGASVVLLGTLALPVMMQARYSPSLAAGTVCSAGTLGILIPPSIMLILMSSQLNVSTGDLFMGAVFPGLILSFLYFAYLFLVALFQPEVAPKPVKTEKLTATDCLHLARSILPALLLMFLVLGSIFFGIATPTESSGMGAFGALILAAANKRLNLSVFKQALHSTMHTLGFIAAIFVGATCFSLVLRLLGGDDLIANSILQLGSGNYGTILIILAIVFILGFFLEWIEITLIMIPIVSPIIKTMDFQWVANSGMDSSSQPALIWFAILCAVVLQTSFLTPPVGFALFYTKGVAPKEIRLSHIYKGVVPFILIQLVALLLVVVFPQLVTWLPAVSY